MNEVSEQVCEECGSEVDESWKTLCETCNEEFETRSDLQDAEEATRRFRRQLDEFEGELKAGASLAYLRGRLAVLVEARDADKAAWARF